MPYDDIYALGVITIQLITKRANVIGPNYKHVSTIAEEEYKETGHVLHQTLITSSCNQLEAKRITKLNFEKRVSNWIRKTVEFIRH